jgi:hypothetical protein
VSLEKQTCQVSLGCEWFFFEKRKDKMKRKIMITPKLFIYLVTILGVILLPACTATIPAVSSSGGVRVWLDQPVDGDVITLAPVSLKAHARNEASGGVNRIDFLVNSIIVGSANTRDRWSMPRCPGTPQSRGCI